MKNTWKKLIVGTFAFAIILAGMNLLSVQGSKVQAAGTETSVKYYVQEYTGEQVNSYKSTDVAPVPTPEQGQEKYNDWLFAGWFTDKTCSKALEGAIDTDATYYAKYVPAEVLSVKVQVTKDTDEKSPNADMRLVSTVDSLQYENVGFEVYYNGSTKAVKVNATTVYRRIEAGKGGVDYGFSPNIFDTQSKYFITVTLKNVVNKNFANGFYIRPYWETLDGTTVYGVSRYARVEDSYLNIVNVPVRLVSDSATATTGTVNVAYDTEKFTYLDAYASTLANGTTTSTPGLVNGSIFGEVKKEDESTLGTVTITGPTDATDAKKINGEIAHLRFQAKDIATLPKKNVFEVSSEDLKDNIVAPVSVYNHFRIAAAYNTVLGPDETWYDSNETEFVITTAEELYGFASLVNAGTFGTKKVYLASNITVNDTDIDPTAENWATVSAGLVKWTPIGKINSGTNWNLDTSDFKGGFDGQGHTISGLYTDISTASGDGSMAANWCAGLFGSVYTDLQIDNVKVVNSYFKANHYAGSIVGLLKNGTINNTYSQATVVARSSAAGGIAGGIRTNTAGTKGTIQNSWFDGSVSANGSICGGIVGLCQISSEIKNCLNEGSVGTVKYNGGIIGQIAQNISVSIEDCLNIGTVSGTSTVGTVVGNALATPTTTDVYALAVSGKKPAGSGSITVTEISNESDIRGYAALADNQLGNTFDFDNTWVVRQSDTPVLKSWVTSGALYTPDTEWAGSGTEEDPWIIKTAYELYGLANSVNAGTTYEGKYFKLGANIIVNSGTASRWEDEAPKYSWIPIGTSTAITFNGHFNTTGPVREIKGLYVNQTANHAGLFGAVKNGSVKNIKVTNSYVEGGSFVAAFAGFTNNATIENVYTNATVVGSGSAIGSVIGYQVKGDVRNAWFDGAVTGVNSQQYVAGVVGRIVDGNGAVIENCLATGTVVSGRLDGNAYAGGILGGTANNATVSNCFVALKSPLTTKGATGCVGSIAGGCSANTLTVKNSYAASGVYSKTHGTEGAGKESVTATVLTNYTGGDAYLNTTLDFDRHEEALPQAYHKDGIWVAREGKAPGLKIFVSEEDRMELVNQNMYRADKNWYNTTDTEFTIDNAEEFVGFMSLVNAGTSFEGKKVYLGADIELNIGKASDWYAGKNEGKLYNLIPIGNAGKKFTGTFDGKGHSIKGVYADHPSAGQIGLFGQVADGSVVRDFKLTNSYFYSGKNNGAAAICGWYGGGTFDTIYSDAYVHGVGQHIAGMIAVANAGTTIRNCWFAGTMKAGNSFSGGIISFIGATNITIESCLNTGSLTGTSEIGGIVGRTAANTTIKDSLNVGTIKSTTGSLRKGAIVGWPEAGTLTCENVYGLGTDAELFVTKAGDKTAGGSVTGTYAGVADLTGANGFLNTWLNFDRPELPTSVTGKWVAVADSTPVLKSFLGDAEKVSLDGQNMYRVDTRWYDAEAKSYVIDTAEELIGFATLVNGGTSFAEKTVTLGADIVVNTGKADDWASGKNTASLYPWAPIGTTTNPFDGKFNTDNDIYEISGLYAISSKSEKSTWYVGLFGYVKNAEVKNIKVLNSYIQAAYYAGAIVGTSETSTIDTVYTNAIVDATTGNSGGVLGSIVGGTLSQAWFEGSITNPGQYTGGIVGVSQGEATINNCLATGSVTSTTSKANAYAGGIVGGATGATTVSNCLSALESFSVKTATASGSVSGGIGIAGVTASITNSYAVEEIYTKTHGTGNGSFTATITALDDLTNYKGYMNTNLDFNNTWVAMEESAPRLQIFAPVEGRLDTESWYTKEGADGTAENPYIINAVADMYGLAKRVNTGNTFDGLHIKLDADLTFNTDTDFAKEGYVAKYVWTPIGTSSKQFKGKFNEVGDMHKIEGLYVNAIGDNVGLFGYTNGATIKNLEIVDSYIKGTGIYVSAVAGYSLLTTIDVVHVDARVIGSGRVGGFAGRLDGGSVNRCWFEGTVESTTANQQYTGAIVGQVGGSNAGAISNCLAEGTVKVARTTGNAYAGGILGGSSVVAATITNCLSAVDSITTAGATGCLGSFVGGNNASVVTTSGSYVINVSGLPAKVNGTGASDGTYTGTATVVAAEALYDAEAYERLDAGYWAARVGNYPIPSVFATDADYAKAATKNALYASDTTFEQEQDGTYLISSAAELYGLAYLSQNDSFEGTTFKLTEDITINHQTLDANTTEATSYEWLPIGSQSVPFKGIFNGDGHTISGLYKYFDNTYDKARWTGLFDTTEGCVVENLNIENTYFTYVYNGVNKDPSRIGSVAGYGGGTFRNISSTASLINDGRGTGGIIGQSTTNVEITNCWFGGEAVCKTTTQSSYLGGLIGFATAGDVTIAHSHVSGDVLGGSYHVGGLVGNIQGAVQATITDSMFNGNFKASDDVSGDVFKHGQLVGTLVANAASATGGKAPSLTVSNCYGVNNFASYDVGALTSYTHTDETVYTPTVTGSGNVSVKEDRLIGYAGNTASLDYNGYWVLTKSGTPMLKSFAKADDIYDGSQLTNLFKLDTFSKTLADAEEVGAGRYTIKITGSTKAIYDQYCESLDAGIFDPYNNDQSSDLNSGGVYNKVYTSSACEDASNNDWYINATFLTTSGTSGTITITVSSAEVLSQHLKADSIVSYAAEEGYTTSGLTPTFHMIEQKFQDPAASYVIQLSNGHLIVIDGGVNSEAPYLMEYLESLVPEGKKPIVEAWVLSHAHMDHIDSFRGFVTNASKYQGKLYLEGIYFSEASDVVMSTYDDGHHHYTPYIHRIGSVFQTTKGKEPQIYRMYTGQRYTFDTVVMDVMLANEQFTLSDYVRASQVTNPSVFNETSTWTMFTINGKINGKKLLTAGDSNYIGKEFIVNNYSEDYLTVDIFTALHHGENINREKGSSLVYPTNDDFSNAITVKGAVLYAYPTDWYQEQSKTTIMKRIKVFMELQVSKGMSGIAATYESGSTAGSNPEDYFYHGQGTVVLTFGDSITANVKAHNDWVNDYAPATTTTPEE